MRDACNANHLDGMFIIICIIVLHRYTLHPTTYLIEIQKRPRPEVRPRCTQRGSKVCSPWCRGGMCGGALSACQDVVGRGDTFTASEHRVEGTGCRVSGWGGGGRESVSFSQIVCRCANQQGKSCYTGYGPGTRPRARTHTHTHTHTHLAPVRAHTYTLQGVASRSSSAHGLARNTPPNLTHTHPRGGRRRRRVRAMPSPRARAPHARACPQA